MAFFRNTEIRLRNEEIEQQNECQLDSGEPIRLVDTMEALDELVDLLRHGDQKLIGIDAEWRPHFLSAYELCVVFGIAFNKNRFIPLKVSPSSKSPQRRRCTLWTFTFWTRKRSWPSKTGSSSSTPSFAPRDS